MTHPHTPHGPTAATIAVMIALGCTLAGMPPTAEAQVPPDPTQIQAYRGLHAAAHQGDLATLQTLILQARTRGESLDPRDAHGRTPVHVATFARQGEAIRLLAQGGARLDLLENDRYDAVTIASVANDARTLRVLLELGASARLTTSRYDGTALIAAAHLGHAEVVRLLIAAGAPLDHVNNLHWTALIESIVLGDGGPAHQQTLAALLAAGASTRLTDRQGLTPVQLARSRGFRAMVQMLEAAGAR